MYRGWGVILLVVYSSPAGTLLPCLPSSLLLLQQQVPYSNLPSCCVNPFRIAKRFPILSPSRFVPKNVFQF